MVSVTGDRAEPARSECGDRSAGQREVGGVEPAVGRQIVPGDRRGGLAAALIACRLGDGDGGAARGAGRRGQRRNHEIGPHLDSRTGPELLDSADSATMFPGSATTGRSRARSPANRAAPAIRSRRVTRTTASAGSVPPAELDVAAVEPGVLRQIERPLGRTRCGAALVLDRIGHAQGASRPPQGRDRDSQHGEVGPQLQRAARPDVVGLAVSATAPGPSALAST